MDSNNIHGSVTIGVDLGGSNTALAAVDRNGNIIDIESFSTALPTATLWADELCRRIKCMAERNMLQGLITGIGIGAPCANANTGCIEGATDLPWQSPIPLAEMVNRRLGLPVTVSNDANAAAIGEMSYGCAKGMSDFILLTLGTGVGSGIVCDGHLLSGTRGFAGELGHMTFPFASDRPCRCGRNGCLQTVASAKGIVETARRLLAKDSTPSSLREIPLSELTSEKIARAARAGDSTALETFRFTGHCLGLAAAEFASITDPEAIILFGGVARSADLLLDHMREAYEGAALHIYRNRVRFLTTEINDSDAAVLGAASLPYICK